MMPNPIWERRTHDFGGEFCRFVEGMIHSFAVLTRQLTSSATSEGGQKTTFLKVFFLCPFLGAKRIGIAVKKLSLLKTLQLVSFTNRNVDIISSIMSDGGRLREI